MATQIIALEEGWERLKTEGIGKLQTIIENGYNSKFTPEEYSLLYTTVYNMCTQRTPYNWSEQLYQRYCESINDYLTKTLPTLKAKHEEFLLRELVHRWENHQIMVKWLSRFFTYLDRYYITRNSLSPLATVGVNSFRTIMFDEVKKTDAVPAMLTIVQKEREGDQVDRSLLKNSVEVFLGVSPGSLSVYQADFEEPYLEATGQHYARVSQHWVEDDSFPAYMIKAEECLHAEKNRVEHCLHSSSLEKVLKVAETELLANHQQLLLEKENSGCRVLLTDKKVTDLSRMFRLFSRVPEGLQPIAAIFRKHITEEGNELVAKREAGQEANEFIQSFIDLHDASLETVAQCFDGHNMFHKAMKEAFEDFLNKDAGEMSTAELISNFCDFILKKSGEKMSEEGIEETLEKVVQLFNYLRDKDLFVEFYRKQLAKRLLSNKSYSEDL